MSPFLSSFLLFLLLQQQCPTEHVLLFNVSLFIKSISLASSAICLLPSGPPFLLFGSPASFILSTHPFLSLHHPVLLTHFNPFLILSFALLFSLSLLFCYISFFSLIFPFFLTLALNEFPFPLSPCSLFCLSSSAAAQRHLSHRSWSQRFLLLQWCSGGLKELGAPVGHLPSMHLGWMRRKKRKWWPAWRSDEKVRRRSPRSVLGSDDDAGGLKKEEEEEVN